MKFLNYLVKFFKKENIEKLPKMKESSFSTFAQEQKINKCLHDWDEHGKAVIFNYLIITATCKLCGTRRK